MHAGIYSQYSSHAPDVQYPELLCMDQSARTHRGGPPVLHCSHATETGASIASWFHLTLTMGSDWIYQEDERFYCLITV